MDEPIDILPIDERPPPAPRPTRPTGHKAVMATAALVAAAVAIVLLGGDGDDRPSADPPPSTVPDSPTTIEPESTVGNGRDTAAPLPEATVVPSAMLAARADVRVEADDPFLTRPDAGFGLCAVDADLACTLVPATDHEVLGGRFGITLSLPRRFTAWTGDLHDCVLDAPCEVRLWAFDDFIIERSVPVDFAAGAVDSAVPMHVVPRMNLAPDGAVGVTGPADSDVIALQCILGRDGACAKHETLLLSDGTTATGTVAVSRRIFTPRGPYDCGTGACELRFIRSDAAYSTPVRLVFSTIEDLAVPRVAARPSDDLTHGAVVELRAPHEHTGVVGYSLCIPEHLLCAPLGAVPATEPLITRIPRWLQDRNEPSAVHDCASTVCTVRATIAGTFVDLPLTFTVDDASPPAVEVVVSQRLGATVAPGDTIAVAVRGLFVPDPEEPSPSDVSVRFCETRDAPRVECATAIGVGTEIRGDGSIDTTVVIPDFDRQRARLLPDGVRAPFCSATCWIVVEPRVPVPGGAVTINIVTPADVAG